MMFLEKYNFPRFIKNRNRKYEEAYITKEIRFIIRKFTIDNSKVR